MFNEYDNYSGSEWTYARERAQVKETNKTAQEFVPSKQNATPKEKSVSTKAKEKTPRSKKGKGIALANMLVATVVTVTATVGSGIISQRKADVNLKEIWAGEQEISYQIEVLQTEADLVVTLENDFTFREEKLTVGENEGEFSSLAPNMEYTLSVKFSDGIRETVKKQKVKTNGQNPKPEPEPEPTPKPEQDVEIDFIPAQSINGNLTVTTRVKEDVAIEYEQILLKICDGSQALMEVYGIEEHIYYASAESGEVFVDLIGQPMEIGVEGVFSTSSGVVEIVGLKPKVGGGASTDTSDRYEVVVLHEMEVQLFNGETGIRSVDVAPAEGDSTLRITVDFIDENGLWTTQMNDYDEEFKIMVSVYDSTYESTPFESHILHSGETVEFIIPQDEYLSGIATIEIYCFNQENEMELIFYQSDAEIVGENFVRN